MFRLPMSSYNRRRLDFGASWTRRAIVCPFYCGRDGFRGSGLSPYIHNGELSSKAVKRRQWAEEVGKTGREGRRKEKRTRKRGKRARKKTRAGRFRKRRGESQSFLFRDADQESKTRMRNNALRTGPRQAVE
ncbi:hypothetical protein TNCV_3814871 [Trichonephila clavipes]|nr:hypothetical protein TNCV_3814871 [Trichonephila clavipes]